VLLGISDGTYKKAELEGELDRPVALTQEQVDTRVAEKKRGEKERLKSYRLLMKEISTEDK